MSDFCREDETEDDLMRDGLHILQKKDGFRFGLDAVLLSSFAQVKKSERVLDMGTGCGIIPILLQAKSEGKDLTGLEILPELADMAARSVRMNGLEDRIQIINGDCREAGQLFGEASFDIVTCNPPYLKDDIPKSENTEKMISRHEVCLTLKEMAREASAVLKPHGRFYLVHRPERLVEILTVLQDNRLTPKSLRFVHPYADSPASLVLLEARKDARQALKTEPPLIIYERAGIYTEEVAKMYGAAQMGDSSLKER